MHSKLTAWGSNKELAIRCATLSLFVCSFPSFPSELVKDPFTTTITVKIHMQ